MPDRETLPSTSPLAVSIDVLPMPAAMLDDRLCVVAANPAFRALLAGAGRIVGAPLSKVLRAAGAAKVETGLGKIFRIQAGGGERAFQVQLHANGAGSLVLVNDVEEAGVAVDPLHMAKDVNAQLMHEAEIGSWRYDPDMDLYTVSSALSFGYSEVAAPVPRALMDQILHRDDRAKSEAIRERITRDGGSDDTELRYLIPGGGWTHLQVHFRSGARLPSGLYEMFGVSHNVTALARARDEAKAIAHRLDLALKASRAGVFEYDFRKDTYWASAEFAAMVGPEASAGMGSDIFAILDEADADTVRRLLGRTAELGGAADVAGADWADVRLRRPDGERWVRVYFEVERGADDPPRRGVGLMIDIDEAKRQELAVIEARETAEAATRAKSDFLASVSHEIRTPMNGIVGVLNLLRRERITDDGRQLLDEALGCSDMLSGLINDVLDFSKIEAGKLEIAAAPTDAAAVVEGVVSLVRPQADAKGLTLTTFIEPDLGWALIDPMRLRQCLFNLIGNAIKFTAGGAVTVRVSALGEGPARKLRFEVEDTGIGLPEDARERLFDRFQQVDGGAARRFGGTGLGLAISRQLARMMDGELDYWSREGEGSTFWLEIAAPSAAPQEDTPEAIGETPLAGLGVLVVDDNRVNRLVAVKLLEALGASARSVESGPAAIEAVAAQDFDLVLMDVNMPGMDGLEATRRIRASGPKGAGVPIIALTADVMRHQQQKYLAAGMNGLVPKPFSPARLLAEVARLSASPAPDEAAAA